MRVLRAAGAVLASALIVTLLPSAVAAAEPAGAVFTMSNAASSNKVLAWSRAANGTLTFAGRTATGGRGTGGGLANQGGLALSADGKWLYVVNAGSDSVSVFRVNGASLTRTDVEFARGDRPVSVAVHGSLVYVLNAGGKGNIRGFRRDAAGRLGFIANSGRPLSARRVQPVQIGFNPAGTHLYVTERRTDRITRYAIGASGAAGAPRWTNSAGAEPWGFDWTATGLLVVSEAGDHANDGSSASSYRFGGGSAPITVSGAVPTTETAACWAVVTPDGRFAYVTNTPDHSISGFSIGAGGKLRLLTANGRTAVTGAGSLPIDLETSADGRYLYVLLAGTDRIAAFAVRSDGELSGRPGAAGLPGAANGLVAR